VDADWRTLERRSLAARGDQDLLAQALRARRRAGAPVSRRLLDMRVHPAREFGSRLHLRVWARLPSGALEEVGRTPRWLGRPLEVPEHRQWWVEPLVPPRNDGLRELAADLARHEVPGLELPASRVNDAGLAHLRGVTGLTMLWIKGGRHLTDRALGHLAELSALTSLKLWGCAAVTDEGAATLSRVTELTSLSLPGAQLTDRGAAELARLERLTELALNSSRVGDAGLGHLSRLEGLASLDLDSCPVGDAGLAHVGRLADLVKLSLLGCRAVTDAGLRHLEGLEQLQLVILGPDVTEDGAAALQRARPGCVVSRRWDPRAWDHYPWDGARG